VKTSFPDVLAAGVHGAHRTRSTLRPKTRDVVIFVSDIEAPLITRDDENDE
jgi:hypothetical protein